MLTSNNAFNERFYRGQGLKPAGCRGATVSDDNFVCFEFRRFISSCSGRTFKAEPISPRNPAIRNNQISDELNRRSAKETSDAVLQKRDQGTTYEYIEMEMTSSAAWI